MPARNLPNTAKVWEAVRATGKARDQDLLSKARDAGLT
jgi:hypothetical protein